jgi:hypothetical protein
MHSIRKTLYSKYYTSKIKINNSEMYKGIEAEKITSACVILSFVCDSLKRGGGVQLLIPGLFNDVFSNTSVV